jgi:hypothetical protein
MKQSGAEIDLARDSPRVSAPLSSWISPKTTNALRLGHANSNGGSRANSRNSNRARIELSDQVPPQDSDGPEVMSTRALRINLLTPPYPMSRTLSSDAFQEVRA